jgi:hypothetical protein
LKEIQDITAAFVDHEGLYFALADKLSQSYGRVLYTDAGEEAMDTINRAILGDSHPENPKLERVDDILLRQNEVDLWIFPDSKEAGLQELLEEMGKPVWGSRRASVLEHSREAFIEVLKSQGMDVPKFERIVGISRLRDYLRDKKDQVIKISKYRGTMETHKWSNYDDGEAWLDWMAVKLGGVKDIWPFLVFDKIDSPLELGGDTYAVRGNFPDSMMDGYEWKDKGYFGAFKDRLDMPVQTQAVMQTFETILRVFRFTNFWSMEIKPDEKHSYFIDPTPRAPLPGSATQMELYDNLPEIIAAGAAGDLVQPEPVADYSAECCLTLDCKPPQMASVRIPAELKQWVKLGGVCTVKGRDWFPEVTPDHGQEIGWLVAIGDSPREVVEKMLGYKELLPPGVTAHTDSMIDLLKEIRDAEEKGIEFSPHPIPKPELVVTADE